MLGVWWMVYDDCTNSPSVDVVMGLVSGIESETGRTAPWCGEGARTGVKWPGTFPTTWPLLFGCRWGRDNNQKKHNSARVFNFKEWFILSRFKGCSCQTCAEWFTPSLEFISFCFWFVFKMRTMGYVQESVLKCTVDCQKLANIKIYQ